MGHHRFYKTRVVVEEVVSNDPNPHCYIIVPGWDSNKKIRLLLADFPPEIKASVNQKSRLYADINLAVEQEAELLFINWELRGEIEMIELPSEDRIAQLYELALGIATKAHEGQTRWDKTPYIQHPIAVAESLTGYDKVAGVLHDVIEDSDITKEDLLAAGIPAPIVNALSLLTHGQESYASYISKISSSNNMMAIRVKSADLIHNLSDLERQRNRQRFDKYLLALKVLNPDLLAYAWSPSGKNVFSLETGKRGRVESKPDEFTRIRWEDGAVSEFAGDDKTIGNLRV